MGMEFIKGGILIYFKFVKIIKLNYYTKIQTPQLYLETMF